MKNKKFIIAAVIIVQIIFAVVFYLSSDVQDVTLAKDDIYEYDDGWLYTSDEETKILDVIPYMGKSKRHQVVSTTNSIPKEYCGKTLCFLAADKYIKIYVDDELIYSFGLGDHRWAGHTPGSVVVYADIPADAAGRKIKIEAYSPYKNYASYITNMIVGKKELCILYMMKKHMIPFIICICLFVCSIIIFMFAIYRKLTNQTYLPMICLGMYMVVMGIYNIIETKLPMIFWGNQYVYSNAVFLSLMLAPLLIVTYMHSISTRYKKTLDILFYISLLNIVVQIMLQCLNVLDFLEMAFVSHTISALIISIVLIEETLSMIKNKRFTVNYMGILAMGGCGAIDLVRCYTVRVGDLSKYNRVGLLIFGICSTIYYMRDIVENQISYAQNKRQEEYSSEIIKTLVTAIDAKDIYTRGHSIRVAEYAAALARKMGFSQERVKQVTYKAMLHDVGKIGIPDQVLNKNEKLTEDEYELIKRHTTIGCDILMEVTSLSEVSLAARNHHERYDGTGYPDGLSGKDIPIEARVVGIVDAFDAMSTNRAYRKALSKDEICQELKKGRGTQFDPEITDIFLEMYENGELDDIISTGQHNEYDLECILKETR